MLSPKIGWTSGQTSQGVLYFGKTVDGGAQWSHYTNSKDLVGIGFLNRNLGWRSMTSLPPSGDVAWKVYFTANGGGRWKKVFSAKLPSTSVTSAPFFLNRRRGWILNIAGPEWYVMETTNGGKNFRRVSQHVLGGAGVTPIGVTFLTPSRGWTLVASTGAGAGGINFLMTTTDGGARWAEVRNLPKLPTVEQFGFTSVESGWVLAPVREKPGRSQITPIGTALYKTTDGGRSWSRVYDSASRTMTNLVFVGPKLGYAAADHAILKTDNGGRDWTVVYVNPKITFETMWSLNRYSRFSQ
jgi:hypothetical protein